MKKKLLLFGVTLLAVATVGIVQLSAKASVDSTPDCDKYAIIYCGAKDEAQFKQRFNNDGHYKDHTKVYAAFGIDKSDVTGMVSGIVWRDGRVTVGGKTVATGAYDAARNLGGTPIPGTTAAITSVSTFGSEGQTAMVKMVNDEFKFAIVESCGNPVKAKPVPKPVYKCNSLVANKITRNEYGFTASASASGGASIVNYTYNFGDGQTKTSTSKVEKHTYAKPGTYTATVTANVKVGNSTKPVTGPQCQTKVVIETPPPTPAATCDQLTQNQITRTEFRFDGRATVSGGASIVNYIFDFGDNTTPETVTNPVNVRHNYAKEGTYTAKLSVTVKINGQTKVITNSLKCMAQVVVSPPEECKPGIPTGDIRCTECKPGIPNGDVRCTECKPGIPAGDDRCEECKPGIPKNDVRCEETPTELPHTGPMDIIGGTIGLGSLVTAAGYYVSSRRNLLSELLKR